MRLYFRASPLLPMDRHHGPMDFRGRRRRVPRPHPPLQLLRPPIRASNTCRAARWSSPELQISDGFGPADWFPGDHPAMPNIVAHGKQPDVRACALCHYPNGKGRAENAGITGFPTAYFIQQMHDFRDGNRKSADSRKANTNAMIAIAKGMTEEEIKAAAEYFGAMQWTPWIKVVETNTVPKTRNAGGLFLALDGSDKEPIGDRIIEVPVDTEGTEVLRNPRSSFIAYVPDKSLKDGLAEVKSGQVRNLPRCRSEGPRTGTRYRRALSESYLVRQMC